MVRISAFRYLVPGKRSTLPSAQEEKAKSMGLGDCGLEATEIELTKFLLSHGVAVSTNSIGNKHPLYQKVGAISNGLSERNDFMTELKEWLLGNLNMTARNASTDTSEQFYDVYIFFYSGSGSDGDGDVMLPQNKTSAMDAAFATQQ